MDNETSTGVEVVEERAGRPLTFENATAAPMTPQASRFLTVKDVMQDMHISESSACKIIRQINDKLKQRGLMTFRGRVLKRAYLEATGGTAAE